MSSKLTRPHLSILTAFAEGGGAGDMDIHGRVTVGPTRHPVQGDTIAWLVLVANGLVAGEGGKLILTELGRQTAHEIIAGRVREAR